MARHAASTSYGRKSGNVRGRGPRKGAPNAGRPPETFLNRMALIAERNKTVANVEKILSDPDHPAFMKALEFAADRGFGKVSQRNEHTGEDGGPVEHVVRIVREGRRITSS